MAAGVDFIRFNSDVDTSSTEDVVTEWNTEVQSSGDEDGLSRDIYYWMGKKYFMCVLTQHIASTASAPTSIIDMDSKVQAAQRHYPFTDHFRLMQDQAGLSLPSDFDHIYSGDYEGLTIHIGRNVLGGSRTSKKMMVQSLRRFCVLRPAVSRSDTPPDGYADPTLAQFAVALKEKGDAMGTSPQYEVKTLRQYPASFRATVSLQGRSFDGESSTKKQARHEAAKKACRGMGVVPA
ncbi:hypothetical protein B0A55_11915 [Friedmanniomyces simplex]|uniref:DRBM domain-containing protein n=1 Tax=Friedmanniomyces simplex TaxID=329884 RepID=A0A4U0WRN1_9PEZI|nr:hypothetical protein B0A55_11915 [Friedmanniomyces simplex]